MIQIKGLSQQQSIKRHESIQILSQWYPALRFENRIIYNVSEFSNKFLGVLIFYHTNGVAVADWDPNEYKMFQIFYKMIMETAFYLEQMEKERQRVFKQLYKKQQQQQMNQQKIYFQNQGGNQNWDNQANNQWCQNFNNSQTFNGNQGNQSQGNYNYNNQTHNHGYHNSHSQGFHNQQGNYSQHVETEGKTVTITNEAINRTLKRYHQANNNFNTKIDMKCQIKLPSVTVHGVEYVLDKIKSTTYKRKLNDS